MELSWSTFLLEIVNFLVLVWLLKRFLYRPVLDAIARRRREIGQTLEAAREERGAGEALQAQYENRLAEWAQEKEAARKTLGEELEAERRRRLEALETELEAEREKHRVVAERAERETVRRLEGEALALGADFTARLLTRLAGPELERLLVDAALEDLAALPEDRREDLRRACGNGDGPLEVSSAYPLPESQRTRLEQALAELAGGGIECRYRQDPELLGGLRMRLGPWLLHADLRDELRSFAESGRD